MTTKWIFPYAVVLSVLSVCTSQAQEVLPRPSGPYPATAGMPGSLPKDPGMTAPAGQPDASPASAADTANAGQGLSSWITYTHPDCCGPIGGNGSIHSEVFVRTGPSINVAGGQLKDTLRHGYAIGAGGRSLFFNRAEDKAWTIELSVLNISNHGQRADIPIPFNIVLPSQTIGAAPVPTTINITVHEMNRTSGNLALGREWYLQRPASCNDINWRVGADMFSRIGTLKLDIHELAHRTDTYYGFGLSLHTDLEIPYGCCIFMAGLRAEWAYEWIDVLQPQNSPDLQSVNLLLNVGIRF